METKRKKWFSKKIKRGFLIAVEVTKPFKYGAMYFGGTTSDVFSENVQVKLLYCV